ncbi:MAG: pyruvate kinase [Chloroflexi bacterium]|nr:pyruvate kinase [Chloroflexota bacterium]
MTQIRRTKIVATLGPASESPKVIRTLIDAGVDAVRLNFSYGDLETHGRLIDVVRESAAAAGRDIAILQDLQGPKIRVGDLKSGSVRLRTGAKVRLTSKAIQGTSTRISTTYDLTREVSPGDRILLDDGSIELTVDKVSRGEVICAVVRGGTLKSGKGMNLPGISIRTPAFTAKDRRDLRFGLERGIDAVALSFVRSGKDAEPVRRVMRGSGRSVPVLAKIERPQALRDLDRVLRAFDGVMVARGDLGVEIGPEKVPAAQKRIIRRANALGKPVITATQMLESMTKNARPTRAEASDVANAVLDGTDAVMLSGETAAGRYPEESVRVMDLIVREAESLEAPEAPHIPRKSRSHSICHAAVGLAKEVSASAIAALTRSGRTARILSALRPGVPIFALCERSEVARSLSLFRGVVPISVDKLAGADRVIVQIEDELVARGLVVKGEDVVVVGSAKDGPSRQTNYIRLLRVR